VYTARASSQNRKSEISAAIPNWSAGAEEVDPSGSGSIAMQKSHGRQLESGGRSQDLLGSPGKMPADRGPDLPSGEGHTARSPSARASETLIKFAMLGFPISGANFNRIARINSLERQSRQFVFGALLGAYKAFQICLDG